MKKIVLSATFFFFFQALYSQKLFSYGKKSVDARAFLAAFEKANAMVPAASRSKAIREYLEVYIRSKLKIQEAYARRYDTLASIKSETENLRLQIIDNYMNDPQALLHLTRQAFQRSQKDIHAAHIFISFQSADGVRDAAAVEKKKDEVMKRLAAGEDFLKLAAAFSDDPSAKMNGGDLGFITVFTLPYFLENIIYSVSPGNYSQEIRSKSGYHIFKNIQERAAVGKIRVQQILLAFPPGAEEAERSAIKNRIDSLYELLKNGADFSGLATAFSNDYVSAIAGGNVPALGVGQYEPVFEKTAFSLEKDGDISRPFLTSHGYHIVKRISRLPVIKDSNDRNNMNELKNAVNVAERTAASQKNLVEKIKKQAGYKSFPYKDDGLKTYTDSLLQAGQPGNEVQADKNFPLFKIGDSTLRVADWIGYAQVFRFNSQGGVKPIDELMEEFITTNIMQYYRENLEKYNSDFRNQLNEFKEGNLFFEIMQREIWNRPQTDETGLRKYFESNRTKYNWKPSADAVVYYCSDEATATELHAKIRQNPRDWQTAIAMYEEKVSADSSRIELVNIPSGSNAEIKEGMVTTPVLNPNDKSASFAWVIKLYNGTGPRSFEEAKGLVINDYQNMLDERWIKQLKKKYPVVIDQNVLKTLR
jgi:peptidyl-prolyl cis-trans isomerase SurA